MGERVWFATSNWKDKPSKPSCYTQAQWDARNSSKFNGAPFAGNFAFDPTATTVKAYTQADFDAYKNALQAISQPSCPFARWQVYGEIASLPELKQTDIPVKCGDAEMKVWDGSTYYDRTGASKKFTWDCGKGPKEMEVGIADFKAPSASKDAYIPVCGPGTHIIEITKDEMMKIVWRVSQFDLDASGFSAQTQLNGSTSSVCRDEEVPNYQEYTLTSTASAKSTNKNLNTPISSSGKESDIVGLKWPPCNQMGYNGSDSASATAASSYTDNPAKGTGNGNVTVSASISPQQYKCGSISVSAWAGIDITIKPFSDRNKYIYFVTDSAGVEKIYFDPTGLFNFSMHASGANYYLDPANVAARFSTTVSVFGKSFTLYINGPENGSGGGGGDGIIRTTNFTAGSITITSKKYYPYANSKGEDVYDQDSGAQLKDPLS